MKHKTVLVVVLLILSSSSLVFCQAEASSGVEPLPTQPPNMIPTLKYTLSLKGKACLGNVLVFKQELINISDHDVVIYPEYAQRAILQRAWDRSLTNVPWMHIPQFTQSFGDPIVIGDAPETKQLRPKEAFRGQFRIENEVLTQFYYSAGRYSLRLTYVAPGEDAKSVESNELTFEVRDCSRR